MVLTQSATAIRNGGSAKSAANAPSVYALKCRRGDRLRNRSDWCRNEGISRETGLDPATARDRAGMSVSAISHYEQGRVNTKTGERAYVIPRVVELACEMLLVKRERGEI